MKFQTAINKCVKGALVSNDNMRKEYLEYEKSEKRISPFVQIVLACSIISIGLPNNVPCGAPAAPLAGR